MKSGESIYFAKGLDGQPHVARAVFNEKNISGLLSDSVIFIRFAVPPQV
jgi:hypothetical protein